jgi:Holliday junction resolvase RusA-like endonuclease
MTAEGKALKEAYQWEARAQYRGEPLAKPLKLTVALFFGDRRRRDWDNYHKLSMDALTGIVWEDDSQIVEATVRTGYDKANPRIEVQVDIQ